MEGVGDPLVDSLVETMDVEVDQQGAIVVEQEGVLYFYNTFQRRDKSCSLKLLRCWFNPR
jgi:hypothetical protein